MSTYETRIASSPTAAYRRWSTQPVRKPLLSLLAEVPDTEPVTSVIPPPVAQAPRPSTPGLNVALAAEKRDDYYRIGGAFDEAVMHGARDGYNHLIDRYLIPSYARAISLLTTTDWNTEPPGNLRRMGSAVEYLTTHAGLDPEQRERLAGHWESAVQAIGYLAGVRHPIPLVETALRPGQEATS